MDFESFESAERAERVESRESLESSPAERRSAVRVSPSSPAGAEPPRLAEPISPTASALSLPCVLGFAIAGALAVDYLLHEVPAVYRFRMRRAMRAGIRHARAPLLPVKSPLGLGHSLLPTLVRGPKGCGKSALLTDLARAATADRVPVALVRLSLPPRHVERWGKSLMDSAAEQVCSQIGFPLRRSLVGAYYRNATRVRFAGEVRSYDGPHPSLRVCDAIETLFVVSNELRDERAAAGMTELDAAPVLLFDGMQDLVKDSILRGSGGDKVFETLVSLIRTHGVGRRDVRVFAAADVEALDCDFDKVTVVARGNRWRHYDLPDPEPGVVVDALVARGYTEPDARAMIALCGTRMRLLSEPLVLGPAAIGAATFLANSAKTGEDDIAFIFKRFNGWPGADKLARVLDAVAACGNGEDAGAPRPHITSLPSPLSAADVSDVLFVDHAHGLSFQSTLHANAWARVRGGYAERSAQMA